MTDILVRGEALRSALPRLGKAYGLELECGSDLANQRVTLFLRDCPPDRLTRGLQELLTATPDAPVVWLRDGNTRSLESSAARKRLSAQLRDRDLAIFRAYLDGLRAWYRREAPRLAAQAAQGEKDGQTGLRQAQVAAAATAALLETLGDAEVDQLLRGAPYYSYIRDLPQPVRLWFRRYLSQSFSHLKNVGDKEFEAHAVAYVIARAPHDEHGNKLVESLITPEGHRIARLTVLHVPGARVPLLFRRVLTLPPPDEHDRSRRVTLNLTPTAQASANTLVLCTLDQLLERIASEAGVGIISDGYIRQPVRVPANLKAENYPLGQLIAEVAKPWLAQARWADPDNNTAIVRARDWWLEDAADVPQPLVDELAREFKAGMRPSFAALLRIAELTKPQVHKLVETGACPAAVGVVKPVWYDDTGVKPILQFFARLPEAQQARARSPQGLPLGDAAPDLVERWLGPTLIADVGAVTPLLRRDLVLHIEEVERSPSIQSPGYRFTIRSLGASGCHFEQYVQSPPPFRIDLPGSIPVRPDQPPPPPERG